MEEGKIVRKEKQQNDEIGVPRNTKLLQLKRKICDGQRAVCGFCEITHLFCCCWDSVLNMFWASLTLYTVLEIDSQILSKPKTCSITTTLFFFLNLSNLRYSRRCRTSPRPRWTGGPRCGAFHRQAALRVWLFFPWAVESLTKKNITVECKLSCVFFPEGCAPCSRRKP